MLSTTNALGDIVVDSEQAAVVALCFARRVLVEGAPATRDTLAREASFQWNMPAREALVELDALAEELGVSSLL